MTRTVEHPKLGRVTLCRRLRMRRMVLSVLRDGSVRISYPYGVSASRALDFAESRREWIEKARARQASRCFEVSYTDGMRTRSHTLRIVCTDAKRISVRITDTEAIVRYPAGTEKEEIDTAAKRAYTEALRAEAAAFLPQRIETLAQLHGLRYGKVRIKALRSKWGSCTVRGDINLSLYLMTLPDPLTDFVLLHELCHTVHHNHSAQFHAMLDRLCGGREKALSELLKKHRPPV